MTVAQVRWVLGAVAALLVALVALWLAGVFAPLGLQAYSARRLAEIRQDQASAASVAPVAAATPRSGSASGPVPGGAGDLVGDAPRADLSSTTSAAPGTRQAFQPPAEADIPDNPFGAVIRRGREIFVDTPRAAAAYVGNSLRCVSCHLDAGRLADSSPLWAAYVSYPAFRSKTNSVSSFQQRLQGCFEYSMNGKAPALGSPELEALEVYSYWLASGATVDPQLPGRGYPKLAEPPQGRDAARGEKVYAENCSLCHGADGNGQRSDDGTAVFPALWGPDSFNWGAGMGRISNAAAFVKANMPLGRGGSLSDQQAWDVALYMNSHDRPQDPRYKGSVQATRQAFHDTDDSMYGRKVDGKTLGDSGPPKPFRSNQAQAAR